MEKQFICGCGKAYGSYPALSTHRKTKHNNQNLSGTIIPQQEKARRGRPSYDFKKIPTLTQTHKKHYEGLSIIEFSLLDLEEEFKGKIIGSPHQCNQSTRIDISSSIDNQDNDNNRIQYINEFIGIISNHIKESTLHETVSFLRKLISYGLQTSQLTSMNLYNNFFKKYQNQFKNKQFGLKFYFGVCVMMSKWLCCLGETSSSIEILRKQSIL